MNVRRVAKRPKAGPPVNCPSGSLALPVLLKDFLFDHRIQECSPATIRDYRDELKSFIRFLSDRGCVQAVQVAPFHVRSFLAHLQDLGRAPTTVNRAFGSNSSGPSLSRGSISRTTRYTCGRVIRGIFSPQACCRLRRNAPPSRHRAT